ncbi:MAG: universal stress protein [Acidimicrobiales bacterium]
MSARHHATDESNASVAGGHRIVVGIDGSAASLAALDWSVRQAELTHADLEVIATWEWPTGFGWSMIPEGYDPASDMMTMVQPLLDGLRTDHPSVAVEAKILEGHPAPVLIRESKGADLLVVGSRGHGEFVGMLIGSTSEHCVANAACPVVVFRGNT